MNILIVEDHESVAAGIAHSLRDEGYQVSICDSALAAIDRLAGARFDLLILDINLKLSSGLDVLQHARTKRLPLAIIILSARNTVDQRIAALDRVFREARLVEEGAVGHQLLGFIVCAREPVLAAVGVFILGLHAAARIPVGPLPAELGAEHRTLRLEPVIERRDDARAAAFIFLMREADGVVLAIGLAGAFEHPVAVLVEVREAADVDDPQVERRLT